MLTLEYTDLDGHPRSLPRRRILGESQKRYEQRAIVAAIGVACKVPGPVTLTDEAGGVFWSRKSTHPDCDLGIHVTPGPWRPWEEFGCELAECIRCHSTISRVVPSKEVACG